MGQAHERERFDNRSSTFDRSSRGSKFAARSEQSDRTYRDVLDDTFCIAALFVPSIGVILYLIGGG